jgi:Tol biopolymer transport system component
MLAAALAVALVTEAGLGGDTAPPARPVRVTVTPNGGQADNGGHYPMLSGDGRMIAFLSRSDALVKGDTNSRQDAFVRDLHSGVTTRLEVASAGLGPDTGTWSSAMSAGGRFVAFASRVTRDSPRGKGMNAIFVRDLKTGTTEVVSIASPSEESRGYCWVRAVSMDGRFVTFVSDAADLVAKDTNGKRDVFVHDREMAATSRVSVCSSGAESNGKSNWHDISGDGRLVVFWSEAGNLVEGDTNGVTDIFVHDRETGSTSRASVSSAGRQANGQCLNPAISLDGRYVVFESDASNLDPRDADARADIYIRDLQAGTTEVLSKAPAVAGLCAFFPSVSADGRYCVFEAGRAEKPGKRARRNDVYVHDRKRRSTVKVADGNTLWSHISADGRVIAFGSEASTIVKGDTNGCSDVFVVANPLFEPGDGPLPEPLGGAGDGRPGRGEADPESEAPNEF